MKYITAIVLAAGRGLRFKSKLSKPLNEISNKPIIIYCLNTLSRLPDIRDIIVVANSKNLKDIVRKIRQYRIGKIKDVVCGGRARQDSVVNGLAAIDSRTEWVLIHDAVRPFIEQRAVSTLIRKAKMTGAAILGVPVKATIKQVTSHQSPATSRFMIEKTLDRKYLWEIQTPQVFRKDLILRAHEEYKGVSVSDDASLVERLGVQVKVVIGSYFNIKITTPEDLVLAEAIVRNSKSKILPTKSGSR